MKVSIIGSGSWGSAFAHHLSRIGHDVTVYGIDKSLIEYVREKRENPHFLPGVILDSRIKWTYEIEDIRDCEVFVMAISAQAISGFLSQNRDLLSDKIFVNLSKGIDLNSLKTIGQLVREKTNCKYFCISGPSHAEEVGIDTPTAVTIAGDDEAIAKKLQKEFSSDTFRIYYSKDTTGVELAAAFKNVLAIMIGLADGLGFGDNTKAAIMTRGSFEIMRLAMSYGSKLETFLGLSGYGDIIVTCTSLHSRNRRWGKFIAQGYSVEEASQKVGMVVEGVKTLEAALKMAKEKNIEMPLFENLYKVIYEAKKPKETVYELMTREFKEETI